MSKSFHTYRKYIYQQSLFHFWVLKKANQRSDGQNIAGPLLHSEVSDGASKHPAWLTEGFLMMSSINKKKWSDLGVVRVLLRLRPCLGIRLLSLQWWTDRLQGRVQVDSPLLLLMSKISDSKWFLVEFGKNLSFPSGSSVFDVWIDPNTQEFTSWNERFLGFCSSLPHGLSKGSKVWLGLGHSSSSVPCPQRRDDQSEVLHRSLGREQVSFDADWARRLRWSIKKQKH